MESEPVNKASVLKLIRHWYYGYDRKFILEAQFLADKTGDEQFIKAVNKYLTGEFGLIIHEMELDPAPTESSEEVGSE